VEVPVRRRQWVQALIIILGLAAGILPFAGPKGCAAAFWCAVAAVGLLRWRRGFPFRARRIFRGQLRCPHDWLDLPAPADDSAADPPD
jgi:hypothetical protein